MTEIANRTEDMARDSALAVRSFRALADMILALPRSVGIKARDAALKAEAVIKASLPEELGDENSAGYLSEGYNSANFVRQQKEVPNRERLNLGQDESASGHGASRMVDRYSSPEAGDDVSRQYDQLSARMSSVEKAIKAIATTMKSMAEAQGIIAKDNRADGRFQEVKDGEVEDDREERDEEDSDEIEKALRGVRVLNGSIRNMIRAVNKKVSLPPSFAVTKANVVSAAQLIDESNLSLGEMMLAKSALARIEAARNGRIDFCTVSRSLESLPGSVKQVLEAA